MSKMEMDLRRAIRENASLECKSDGTGYCAAHLGEALECARCGEALAGSDRAEVALGVIHADCKLPDEELA